MMPMLGLYRCANKNAASPTDPALTIATEHPGFTPPREHAFNRQSFTPLVSYFH